MGVVKRVSSHAAAVVKGMIFIGFTIQIVLGIFWMCCNFMRIQDFGEPESALYRKLFGLSGENPQLMYLLQLALAFYVGCRFMGKLRRRALSGGIPGGWSFVGEGLCREKGLMVWGSLAMVTFPFAMQCHMAILPYSFMGSLFLLMLSFLVGRYAMPRNFKQILSSLLPAVACAGLIVALSGAADADRRESVPRHNIQSALASRMAWPDIWNDQGSWPGDLQEITRDTVWEAAFYPGNMDILLEAIEESVGEEAAKGYYMQIARTGWNRHAYMVVRQIGWDVLGYVVTPFVFRLQLKGEAYDSLTGRNYEVMRGNAPVLTKYYVDYGCWWFGCCLALALCLALVRTVAEGAVGWRKWAAPACICALASAALVCPLAMRGAGLMDYKYTTAVNQLWLAAALLLINPAEDARPPRSFFRNF